MSAGSKAVVASAVRKSVADITLAVDSHFLSGNVHWTGKRIFRNRTVPHEGSHVYGTSPVGARQWIDVGPRTTSCRAIWLGYVYPHRVVIAAHHFLGPNN